VQTFVFLIDQNGRRPDRGLVRGVVFLALEKPHEKSREKPPRENVRDDAPTNAKGKRSGKRRMDLSVYFQVSWRLLHLWANGTEKKGDKRMTPVVYIIFLLLLVYGWAWHK